LRVALFLPRERKLTASKYFLPLAMRWTPIENAVFFECFSVNVKSEKFSSDSVPFQREDCRPSRPIDA
jgi:hypothetical protein